MRRFLDRLKYLLERWVQRGALNQLLVMVTLLGLVAVVGGLLAWAVAGAFAGPSAAIWWAFLRLTDPGYLGDDEGAALRVIATAVTVIGYVVFTGSLIAIMTQWLRQTIQTLENGLTPIAVEGHLLILGWTNRTSAIVQELVRAEGRVRRFLARRGVKRLRIVILAEDVGPARMAELRERLGNGWDERQVVFRQGSSLHLEHLRRVDFARAATILLPGADFAQGGAEAVDARAIKTLLSVTSALGSVPPSKQPAIVAEVFDAGKIPIAQAAYAGALDLVASDAFLSRLIAQNVRHAGLSFVYAELLSHGVGKNLYVRHHPSLAGALFRNLVGAFPHAVPLGVVRPENGLYRSHLDPPGDFVVEAEDRLVFIAAHYADGVPAPDVRPFTPVRRETPPRRPKKWPVRRVLALGWSHKLPALFREFASYGGERFHLDVLSVVPLEERETYLARFGLYDANQLRINQIEGDYTSRTDLLRAEPASYDNIVFLGSDWMDSSEETDARTILGYVLLRAVLDEAAGPSAARQPEILVELLDPENAALFRKRRGEVIVSPRLLSHLLAHVSLRRELNAVFGDLFGPGGSEIVFRCAAAYDLVGREVRFGKVQRLAASRGEIALGVRRYLDRSAPEGGLHLAPALDDTFTLDDKDKVVVLTTHS